MNSNTLKSSKSEFTLPVAAPGAVPDTDDDLSNLTSRDELVAVGVIAGLRAKAAAAFRFTVATVIEVIELAKLKASSAEEQVHAFTDHLKQTVRAYRDFATAYARKTAGYVEGSATAIADTLKAYVALAKKEVVGMQKDLKMKGARAFVVDVVRDALAIARAQAAILSTIVRSNASDKKVQVTAVSAAGGAVALGVSGGATGLAAGGAIGAAIGVIPALFTFGLSIPIGAAIGGGTGLVVGTAVGGTVGAVGAGSAGYGIYTHKDEIGQGVKYVKGKATETTARVRETSSAIVTRATERAGEVTEYVREKASVARTRLVGRSGTGGTEASD